MSDQFRKVAGSPINLDGFSKAVAGDKSQTIELLELYLGEMKPRLEGLKKAVEQRDARRIEEIAHAFSGSSSTCGLSEIAKPLKEMEDCARANDLEKAAAISPRVLELAARVEGAIAAELMKLKAE